MDIREGDALETLKDVGGKVNLLLIDGAFSLYLPVLKLVVIGSTGCAKPRDLILPRIQRCTIRHIRELADHLT